MSTTNDENLVAVPAATSTVTASLGEIDQHTRSIYINPTGISEDAAVVVERLRQDERVEVHSLEAHLRTPLRPRGTVAIHDWADFSELVNRLSDPSHSTMYANVDAGTVTAVFDDHANTNTLDKFGLAVAGWRQHTAVLKLQDDPDWTRWLQFDGKLLPQTDFATVLEDLAHTVVAPDAATLLEVATSFRATRKASFDSTVNIQNGDVQLSWAEETNAKAGTTKSGAVEVPREFTISVAPWRGVDTVTLTARFRYYVDNGQLRIGYALLRPDIARDNAFELILDRIRDEIEGDVPLFKGVAPAAVNAAQ
jgi:uncharacterized protein YfdQ (DUF2303 family)